MLKKFQIRNVFQKKRFLNEIGQKISKYRLQKTLFPFVLNTSLKNFRKMFKNQSLLQNFEQKGKFQNIQIQKEFKKSVFVSPLIQNLEKEKVNRITTKKVKRTKTNKMWFFEKATPIPGISFMKKQKKFYREKKDAFKILQARIGMQNKKTFQKISLSIQNNYKKTFLPKNWAFFVFSNSFLNNSLQKTRVLPHPKTRKKILKYSFLNGKLRKKTNYLLHVHQKRIQTPGDFCTFSHLQKNQPKLEKQRSIMERQNFQQNISFSNSIK